MTRTAAPTISLTGLQGMPLVAPGDDLASMIATAMCDAGIVPGDGDVIVVAQKVVSKAEGRFVDLSDVVPSDRATELASVVRKDSRLVEIILSESTEVVRHRKDVLVVAHRLGWVMANAGVDQSNVGPVGSQRVLLLPEDPDASAAALKRCLDRRFGVNLAVIINDSFGRPWRQGVVGVALGAAGLASLVSLVGEHDLFGRKLQVTEVALADQLADAASLLMGQAAEAIPAVHIRGRLPSAASTPASSLIRPKETDMFR